MTDLRWDERWCEFCGRRTRPVWLGWESKDGPLDFCSYLHWYLWPFRLAWRSRKRRTL